jgi:hypothetical protein
LDYRPNEDNQANTTGDDSQGFNYDLLGFDVNNIFVQDTREELNELVVLEKEEQPELLEPQKKNLLSFNPLAVNELVKEIGAPTQKFKKNRYLKKVMGGNAVESIQSLVKCLGPSVCKENNQFIVAEIPGYTGKLLINKDKIQLNLQSRQQTVHIVEEKEGKVFPNILESDKSEESEEEQPVNSHNNSNLVSMDWEKIREDHKEENRNEFEKKVIDRIFDLVKENMGFEVDKAMVHKWMVVDHGYEGPNASPEFMVNYYKQAVEEFQGEVLINQF